MKGIVPARIPVHKTRKVQLNSHLTEYRILYGNTQKNQEFIKNLFQTPDLYAFYPAEVFL